MPNATSDKSSQGISPGFAQSNFLPAKNIWNNPVSAGKRDILPPRGSDEISPSNSGSLPATTDDPWAPSNPWNAPDGVPTRPASGSTSPSHTRDDRPGLQIPTGGSVAAGFFDVPQSGGGIRNSSYPRKLIADDDKDGAGVVGPYSASYGFDQVAAFRRDRDGSGAVQDGGYLGLGMNTGAFVASSRDSSMPPSRQSHDSGQDVYSLSGRHTPNGSAAAAAATAVAAQNQRQQSSSSFAAANNRAYGFNSNGGSNSNMNSGGGGCGGYGASSASRLVDEDFAERYRKSLKLGETSNNGMTMAMPPAYANLAPQHQPYPPQPGQGPVPPWLDGADGLGIDGYADPYGGQFVSASKKSPTDRVGQFSAAAAAAGHHPNPHHPTPGSPRTFVVGNDMWARPASSSRDPRAAMAALERSLPPQFIQAPPPHHLPYYHPAPQFYPASYSPQYPTSSYDAYQFAHFGRQPMNVSAYSAVPPYMPASPRQQQQQQHMQHMRDLDPAKGMRSMVLEEFKGHKNHGRYTLREIYGHVVEFSGDQHGSRFIQSKLETANSDEKDVLFKEIGPNALQLMKDVFGNYVIQKFFAHGNQIQKKVLAGHMKGKMVDLSLQMYSCRVVQKALEHVLVEQQAEMARELENDVLRVIKDQNGNHVVQKIIELVPRQYVGFIIDSVRGQVSQLASHLYGCRVIQRLLEFGSEQDKRDLLEELHAAAPILVTDQYGNYVAQHIIQLGKPEDRSRMIGLVTGQVLTLSKHKFASNVVEKCIQHGTEEERATIQMIITDRGSDPAGPLYGMMKDQYGNYVIQKMYTQLQGAQRTAFLDLLLPLISLAKKANSTRQITALERLIYGPPVKGDDGGGSSPATMTAMSGPAALRVDVASAAPTPSLTNGQNSPQSVSPSPPAVGAVGAPSDPVPQPAQPQQQQPKVNGHGIEPTGPEVKVQAM